MSQQSDKAHVVERTLISVVLVLFLFLSPLTEFWASLSAPWYSPYLVWAIAIFLSWMLQRYLKKNEI